MRILAIRGENLASLARQFAVELAKGELADAGLFAITGPVGAGKSTLLDALCLALFDRTPRLSGRGGSPIGDLGQDRNDWLRANDPRTLLRRDAVDGYAEVDFVGRDGVAYRARWSVRRARRKPDGRLQDPELQLRDLVRDEVVASGRRTEVLSAIHQRLGLDFAQFCRSVLLAQGEFHAFLHAAAGDRAKLLETLTGASIYRRLSKAAHERRREGELDVGKLRAQVDASEVLATDDRKQLEAEVAAFAEQIKVCDVGIDYAQRYVSWHENFAKLQRDEGEANAALQQAVAQNTAAEPRRVALQARQRAFAVVPRWEVAQDARERSRVSEQQVADKRELADAARNERQRRTEAMADALRRQLGIEGDAPSIIAELPKWEPALGRWQEADDALSQERQRQPKLAEDVRLAEARVATLQGKRAELDALRASAAQAFEQADRAMAVADFDALRERREQLTVRQREHAQREQALQSWQQAEADLLVQQAAESKAVESVAAADARRAVAAKERQVAGDGLAEVRAQLRMAEQQHGLEALRAQLVDGEPCPLCGAAEHPASGHPGEDLASLQREATARQEAHDRAQRELAEADAAQQQARRDAGKQRLVVESGAKAAAVAAEALRALLQGVCEPEQAKGELMSQSKKLQAEDEQCGKLEREADKRARALRGAREAVQRGEQSTAQLTRDLGAVEMAKRAAVDVEQQSHQRCAQLRASADAQRQVVASACEPHDGAVAAVEAMAGARLATLRELHALAEGHAQGAKRDDAARAELASAEARSQQVREQCAKAEENLAHTLAVHGVAEDDAAIASRLGAEALAEEAHALQQLLDEVSKRRTELQLRSRQRREHEDHDQPSLDAADAKQALEDARLAKQELVKQHSEKHGDVVFDDRMRKARGELQPKLEHAERALDVWRTLDELIGSSTGDAFAVFAQGLTLDLLLLEANRRLEELARRYRLERNAVGETRSSELEFVVVDLDMGGARRSLHTLSGGETFLVSLALALALATLAAPRSRVETLFLDEGFGTLDANSLEIALGALDSLQATGCQVGVISHVDGIAERIGAVVEVRPEGSGQSRVVVRG